MRILFCNIAWMRYYKGNYGRGIDMPEGGGSYVSENNNGNEVYNFLPVDLNFQEDEHESGKYCLGFVETKTTKGNSRNQLHIENICGCELLKDEQFAEDVLVVYCANHPTNNFTSVIGWYKHATVYRYMQEALFEYNGEMDIQEYNAISKVENCVLLPVSERKITKWNVPRKKTGAAYGFGRSNVWFANEFDNKILNQFLNNLVDKINSYEGENWIDKYPEELG